MNSYFLKATMANEPLNLAHEVVGSVMAGYNASSLIPVHLKYEFYYSLRPE